MDNLNKYYQNYKNSDNDFENELNKGNDKDYYSPQSYALFEKKDSSSKKYDLM